MPVTPDTSQEELTDNFLHNEPSWAAHLVPIWPALAAHVLHLTFEPSHPSMTTLIVVSPEWQAAFLIPSRTDINWLLQYLRSCSRYPIFRLHPPPNVRSPASGPNDAIDWRTGDVIFAQPNEGFPASLAAPVFTNGTHVRHRAFWGANFQVQKPLTIVLWRPGFPYTKTTMPPGAHWLADRQTFHGEFEHRYPGTWVPVPWAYDDRPHLCQRPPNPDSLHVIYEHVEGSILQGECMPVSRWSTLQSIAGQLQVDPQQLRLLGADSNAAGRPLRDGDIIHTLDPAIEVPSSLAAVVAPSICLLLLAGWHGPHAGPQGLVLLGLVWLFWCSAAAVPTRDDHFAESSLQWIWSPYRGKLGPFSSLSLAHANPLRTVEPWWNHGLAPVSPVPHLREAHWVPRSPSPVFATILAFGSPAPVALLLPSRISKQLLFSIVAQYFPGLDSLRGRIPMLAEHFPPETEVPLRDGDAVITHSCRWSPALHHQPVSFPSHSAARAQGCWSHPLTFHSDCWVLVWRPDGSPPTAIYAEGQQQWDPEACTLRPALNSLPDGWWPSTHGSTSPTEPLHFAEASGDTGCVNVLLWSQRCCRRLDLEDLTQGRDGDVLPDISGSDPHCIASVPCQTLSPPPNRAGRAARPGSFSLFAIIAWAFASVRRWAAPGGPQLGSLPLSVLPRSLWCPAFAQRGHRGLGT